MLATMRSAPLVVVCPTRHGARLHAAGRAVCSLQPACMLHVVLLHTRERSATSVESGSCAFRVLLCNALLYCVAFLHRCAALRYIVSWHCPSAQAEAEADGRDELCECREHACRVVASAARGEVRARLCRGCAQCTPARASMDRAGMYGHRTGCEGYSMSEGAFRGCPRATDYHERDAWMQMPGVVLQYSLSGMDGIDQTVSTVNRNGAGFCAAADAEPRRIA